MDGIERLMQPGDDGADLLLMLLRRPSWQSDALCREYPEVSWFPGQGEPTAPAVAICRRCAVQQECASFAVDDPEARNHGIWGATSPRMRKQVPVTPRSRIVACEQCRQEFEAMSDRTRFCSKACVVAAHRARKRVA